MKESKYKTVISKHWSYFGKFLRKVEFNLPHSLEFLYLHHSLTFFACLIHSHFLLASFTHIFCLPHSLTFFACLIHSHFFACLIHSHFFTCLIHSHFFICPFTHISLLASFTHIFCLPHSLTFLYLPHSLTFFACFIHSHFFTSLIHLHFFTCLILLHFSTLLAPRLLSVPRSPSRASLTWWAAACRMTCTVCTAARPSLTWCSSRAPRCCTPTGSWWPGPALPSRSCCSLTCRTVSTPGEAPTPPWCGLFQKYFIIFHFQQFCRLNGFLICLKIFILVCLLVECRLVKNVQITIKNVFILVILFCWVRLLQQFFFFVLRH